MPEVDDELPRTTSEIVAWLGECEAKTAEIDGVRSWHGEAALVVAMEYVAALPVSQRGPLFFLRIRGMKRERKERGDWPKLAYASWTKV